MAAQKDYNDNVAFLLKCIESTGTKIDFNKVASDFDVKPNAARMRYTRLRSSLQSQRTGVSTSTARSALPRPTKKHGTVAKVSKPTATRKQQINQDSAYADEQDTGVGSKLHHTRETRGVKIDFSKDLTDDESMSDNNVDEQSSEYVAASDHSAERVVMHSNLPGSKRAKARAVRATSPVNAVLNVPQIASSTVLNPDTAGCINVGNVSDGDKDEDEEAIRSGFMGLASGQMVLEQSFKKRKLHVDDRDISQQSKAMKASPPALVRDSKSNTSANNHNIAGTDHEGGRTSSVTPDDSISVVDNTSTKHDKLERDVRRDGPIPTANGSLMHRLSRLWQ